MGKTPQHPDLPRLDSGAFSDFFSEWWPEPELPVRPSIIPVTEAYDEPTKYESDQIFALRQSRRKSPLGGHKVPMPNGRGIDWYLDQAIKYGPAVYQAISGGNGSSGKGEEVIETGVGAYTTEWVDDQQYATVPTRRQLGMHGHPHPRGLVHRRRRRRKLLTASDKADIAFITGTLGKGEMGRTAIAALLSRRMS